MLVGVMMLEHVRTVSIELKLIALPTTTTTSCADTVVLKTNTTAVLEVTEQAVVPPDAFNVHVFGRVNLICSPAARLLVNGFNVKTRLPTDPVKEEEGTKDFLDAPSTPTMMLFSNPVEV